jgi:hypothetical protein
VYSPLVSPLPSFCFPMADEGDTSKGDRAARRWRGRSELLSGAGKDNDVRPFFSTPLFFKKRSEVLFFIQRKNHSLANTTVLKPQLLWTTKQVIVKKTMVISKTVVLSKYLENILLSNRA